MQKHVFVGGKGESSHGPCLMTKIYTSGNCMFSWHHMDLACLWNKSMTHHLHSCLNFRGRSFVFLVYFHISNLWLSPQWQAERGASRGTRQHTVSQWVNPSAGSHSRVPASFPIFQIRKLPGIVSDEFVRLWFLKKKVLKNPSVWELTLMP